MGTNVYASEEERLAGVKKPTITDEILAKLGDAPLDANFTVDTVLSTLDALGYEIKKKEPAIPPAATETKEN